MLFYAAWDIRYVPLLVALTLVTWAIGRWYVAAWGNVARPRALPPVGIGLNLAVLALFKYADFLRGSAYGLVGAPWRPWALVLPLGISFFVFQKIAYLVDLRRGDRHRYSLLDFALFVGFFPQLIAGPLVRHSEIIPQFSLPPRRAVSGDPTFFRAGVGDQMREFVAKRALGLAGDVLQTWVEEYLRGGDPREAGGARQATVPADGHPGGEVVAADGAQQFGGGPGERGVTVRRVRRRGDLEERKKWPKCSHRRTLLRVTAKT